MKKLFSMLCVLLCAVMLSTSVFAADDAYTIYQRYVKKMKSISSIELTTVQKFIMSDTRTSLELSKQSTRAKLLKTADKKFQMEIQTTSSNELSSFASTKQTSRMYYKDGYLYRVDEKGTKEKVRLRLGMEEALIGMAEINLNLTKEELQDAKVEKIKGGGTKISYKTSLSNLKDSNGVSIKSYFDDLKELDDVNVKFTKMAVNLTLDENDMLKSYASAFEITFTEGNQSAKARITSNVSVKSINAIKKIDFPTDLNSYKEI